MDIVQLSEFLHATQPQVAAALNLSDDNITRRKFLARLQGEITKRGTTAVLRNGIKHGPHRIDLFYGAPSPGNDSAKSLYGLNRFTVTRQLRYSNDNAQLALDLGLFINGLPIITFELKNSLTKQTVDDAINQYKDTRNPRERLFEMGRCLAHFAVDDHEVWFCTHLQGKQSWFLPFNVGHNDGRGNPPNPNGLKTDYLWKRVLTRDSLTGIIENYAQIVEKEAPKTKKKERSQIWPRYHQLDVTRKLLSHVGEQGVGIRYLIQHSAGSGKSNSIAWLAHQLIGLEKDGVPVLDTVMIITDRRNLDRQIRNTIRQFAQVSSTVGHAETSAGLSKLIQEGKKIIISTVQKFPVIVDSIGNEHRDRRFAIMSTALSKAGAEQGRRGAGGGNHRGQDQPLDGEPQDAVQRQLIRLHRHAQEPDPGNLRRCGARRRDGPTRSLPLLLHEAGHPGGFHPGCIGQLHPDRQLLPADQDHRGRPGARQPPRPAQAAPIRREPRDRHRAQGRDHGGPLPRPGDRQAEDRRSGPGHGGDRRCATACRHDGA